MDDETRRFHEARAERLGRDFLAVASPLRRHLADVLPVPGRDLDVGAGPGRDVAVLLAAGHDAVGVEPIDGLRAIAVARHPELADRLHAGELPDGLPTADALGGPFDGIVCWAVLLHVPRADLAGSAHALRERLRPGGRVLVSVPAERPGIRDERDAAGRLFTGVTAEELVACFEGARLSVAALWRDEDSHGRPGHAWATLLFTS